MDLSDNSGKSLPNQMRFSDTTPLGIHSRSRKVKFFSQNAGTFTNLNNTVRIPITSSSSFLDPQFTALSFTLTNTSGQDFQADGSWNSFIQRIRLTSASGGDLEDIRNYGYLVNVLSDLQYSTAQRYTKTMEGYGYAGLLTPTIAVQAGGAAVVAQAAFIGANENSFGTGEPAVTNAAQVTVFLPIMSSLIGTSARKYLPLFLIGPLTLEIEFASGYSPYVTLNATTGYQVTNICLHTQLIEFDADVNISLTQMANKNGLVIHGTTWSSYYNSLPNSDNPNIVISERLESVKSLLTCFSINPADSTTRYMARHPAYVRSLQFKIGSELYPAQPIQGSSEVVFSNSEYMYEALKAIGEYGNSLHQSIISSVNYAATGVTINSVGRCVFGVDLDAFSKSPIESGLSTVLNNPITMQFTTAKGANTMPGSNFTFLLHDITYHLSSQGQFTAHK